jgi:hypothetical protein
VECGKKQKKNAQMLLLICSTRRFTIASDGRVEKEKKKLYLEKSAGALE